MLPGAAGHGGGAMKPRTPIYGLMAEFDDGRGSCCEATRQARQAGYREMDAYSPYPVEGLAAELGLRRTRIPFVVLIGGLVGRGVGFFMQYYTMAVDYPFNVGGRPAQQLAGLHPDHLRGDGAGRVAVGAARDAVPQRPAAAVPPGLQRASASPAPARTGFSCASRRPTRSSTAERTRQFLAEQQASAIMEVPH